jgi:hypothetical protein
VLYMNLSISFHISFPPSFYVSSPLSPPLITNYHVPLAALHQSEAGRLHSIIRSVKAENREKWTQVKKAFTISKEVNMKTLSLLRKEASEREDVLSATRVELEELKSAVSEVLLVMQKESAVHSSLQETPVQTQDDPHTQAHTQQSLTSSLLSASKTLSESLQEMHRRYTLERDEAWRLRGSNSNSALAAAAVQRDLGEYSMRDMISTIIIMTLMLG